MILPIFVGLLPTFHGHCFSKPKERSREGAGTKEGIAACRTPLDSYPAAPL